MKKFFKWASISFGVIIAVLVVGIIALPFVFPLDKIKDFATAKISETIHRQVKIEKVSFDIFSGIKLQKLSVSNRPGFAKKPFISADSIELRYAFWPLFSRQIIIKEIRLVKPQILIEKNARGEFNFSDLSQPSKSVNQPTKKINPEKPSVPPFNLFVSSFSLKNGKISYADYSTKTDSTIKDLQIKVSGFELALIKPIDAYLSANVIYQKKAIPISLSAKVGLNLEKKSANVSPLSFSIAGEKADGAILFSNWEKAPNIKLSLNSKKLSVDPLLALFAAPTSAKKVSKKPLPGETTKAVDSLTGTIPRNLQVDAAFDLENISFQNFKMDKLNFNFSLDNKKAFVDLRDIKIYGGTLTGKANVDLSASGLSYNLQDIKLVDFNSTPFTNALVETFMASQPDHKDLINKVYGTLGVSFSLKGRGVEPDAILANAVGQGDFSLKGGELKRLKTLASIGDVIKSNTLRSDMKLKDLNASFAIKNRVLSTKDLKLEDADIKAVFGGGADLGRMAWVAGNRLDLNLSPALTKNLSPEFSLFRDDKGWLEVTFELTGDLKKTIPVPILNKPIEKAIGKFKIKVDAKKIELEQQGQKKIDEEKKRLEEEAKSKVKEMFKF